MLLLVFAAVKDITVAVTFYHHYEPSYFGSKPLQNKAGGVAKMGTIFVMAKAENDKLIMPKLFTSRLLDAPMWLHTI